MKLALNLLMFVVLAVFMAWLGTRSGDDVTPEASVIVTPQEPGLRAAMTGALTDVQREQKALVQQTNAATESANAATESANKAADAAVKLVESTKLQYNGLNAGVTKLQTGVDEVLKENAELKARILKLENRPLPTCPLPKEYDDTKLQERIDQLENLIKQRWKQLGWRKTIGGNTDIIAKELDRPVYLLFTRNIGCPRCKQLEDNVLSSQSVDEFLRENFVPVRLEYPQDSKTFTTYKVGETPTAVVEYNGRMMKFSPAVVPAEFIAQLKKQTEALLN